MRVLSIRQPWAWAIIHAGKDIENRSWSTKYRGRVLIHASKTNGSLSEFQRAFDFICEQRGGSDGVPVEFLKGGIIGSVEIIDCVSLSTSPWFVGTYGFVLRDPKPLPFTPCRGSLGFFRCPDDVADRLGPW